MCSVPNATKQRVFFEADFLSRSGLPFCVQGENLVLGLRLTLNESCGEGDHVAGVKLTTVVECDYGCPRVSVCSTLILICSEGTKGGGHRCVIELGLSFFNFHKWESENHVHTLHHRLDAFNSLHQKAST